MAITLNDILTPGAKATGMPRPSVAPMDVSLTGSTGSANASVGKGQPMASQGQAVNAVAQTSQSQATTPATPTQQPQAQGSAGHTVETVKESTETTGAPQVEERPKSLSYAELLDKLWPNKPKTDEELDQERKKQKRTSIFAAISDGISALSNLYFTSQYAPDAFDPSKGMTATTKARFDKLKKDYEDNQRQYLSAYMQAAKMDADSADKDRSWRHMLEREKITDQRYEEQAARDKEMAELNRKLAEGKLTKVEYEAEIARIKAEHTEEEIQLENEIKKSTIKKNNSAAGASNARANYYNKESSRGGKKGPKLQLEADEPMYFDNETDYDRTVMRLASEYGVSTYKTEVTQKSHSGKPLKQRSVLRTVKEIAADIERVAASRKNGTTGKWSAFEESGNNNFDVYKVK